MRAVVYRDQLTFETTYPDPQPGSGECVVQVHLAGICSTDLQITHGYMDFRGVLGHEMVGTVLDGSAEWQGKRVACEINCVCRTCDMCQAGLSNHCRTRTVMGIAGRDGCFADLVAVPVSNLHEVPESISDEEAVFIEPLAAALQVVQQVPIDERSNVVVVGSGKLGLLVAQVLAAKGCRLEVVGRNPKTLQACEKRHIRAIHVNDLVLRAEHDVVVECTGAPEGLSLALKLARPRGVIVLKSTFAGEANVDLAPAVINEISIVGSRCGPFGEAIDALARRRIDVRPMISRTLPIERALEAFEAATDRGTIKILLKVNAR